MRGGKSRRKIKPVFPSPVQQSAFRYQQKMNKNQPMNGAVIPTRCMLHPQISLSGWPLGGKSGFRQVDTWRKRNGGAEIFTEVRLKKIPPTDPRGTNMEG